MTYRILSLDGGGVRGFMTATVLHRLEQSVPGWLERVDLFAGTSIGGIMALALAQGKSPAYLLDCFDRLASLVFQPPRQKITGKIWRLVRSAYGQENLASATQELFDGMTLGEMPRKVLVTAFNLDHTAPVSSGRKWLPVIFHNLDRHHEHRKIKVSLLAQYTAATPCYFPSVDGFVDGGVSAMNPSLVAYTCTQDRRLDMACRPAVDEIVLLSLGTGICRDYINRQQHNWGYLQWSRHLVDMMLEGSILMADLQCRQLLGDRYHRLSPLLPAKCHADDIGQKNRLARIAKNLELDKIEVWLRNRWL